MAWFQSDSSWRQRWTAGFNQLIERVKLVEQIVPRVVECGQRIGQLTAQVSDLIQRSQWQRSVLDERARDASGMRERIARLEWKLEHGDGDEDEDEDEDEGCTVDTSVLRRLEQMTLDVQNFRVAFSGQVAQARRVADEASSTLRSAMRAGDERDAAQDRRLQALEKAEYERTQNDRRQLTSGATIAQRMVEADLYAERPSRAFVMQRTDTEAAVAELWRAVKAADPKLASEHAKGLRERVQILADDSCAPDELHVVIDAGKPTERRQKIRLPL